MNINTTSVSQNSPSFGIKYVEPRKWNPDILDTLMKSKLVKQVDCKYPNAEVNYEHFFGHNLLFTLTKDMEPLTLSSLFGLDAMIKEINSTSLEKMLLDHNKYLNEQAAKSQRIENIYKKAEEINNNPNITYEITGELNNKPEVAENKGYKSLFKKIIRIFNKQ